MSKIGKQPVEIPENVKVEVAKDSISVSGPKGTLTLPLRPEVKVELENSKIFLKRANDGKMAKSLHGLIRTLIANMVIGVTAGWEKVLEVVGTGLTAKIEDNKLVLNLGFSHPVEFVPPAGVTLSVIENKIKVEGVDKAKIGEVAARIRALRLPDVYSGKGIRYLGEVVKTRPGKAAKAVGAVGG